MTSISLEVPVVGAKNTTEEPKVGNSIKKTEEFINGANLDGTTNIKAEGIAEANLTAAVVTKLNQKSSGLELKKQAGSLTGAAGIIYLMETNAATLTLPAATLNGQVGIICSNAITAVKLKANAGGKIFGDYVLSTGAAEVTVCANQHLIVEADGTNWRIIAGECRREPTALAKAPLGANETHKASETRPVMVTLTIGNETGVPRTYETLINAEKVGIQELLNGTYQTITFFLPPTYTWEQKGTLSVLEASYMIL